MTHPGLGIGMVGYAFMGSAHSQAEANGAMKELDPRPPALAAPGRAESLRAIRLARGLTAQDVAHRIGVTAACLLRWERRQRTPGVAVMASLAEALGVLVPVVAAFFDDGPFPPPADDTVPGHGLRALRTTRAVPVQRLAQAAGVTTQTVYKWERAETRVPVRLLPPISACLGMDTDDLARRLRTAPRQITKPALTARGLSRLRTQAGLSQARAAELLNVSGTTLRGWERGRVPPLHAIRAMAVVYRIPLKAVVAAAGAEKLALLSPQTWSPGDLAEVLRVLREWSGLHQSEVARRCGASTDSVRAWEHGRQQPGPAQRHRLEVLYGLPPESLLRSYARSSANLDPLPAE